MNIDRRLHVNKSLFIIIYNTLIVSIYKTWINPLDSNGCHLQSTFWSGREQLKGNWSQSSHFWKNTPLKTILLSGL